MAVEPLLGAFQVPHLDERDPLGEPSQPLLAKGGAGPVQGERPNQRAQGRPEQDCRQRYPSAAHLHASAGDFRSSGSLKPRCRAQQTGLALMEPASVLADLLGVEPAVYLRLG
jgi:hypothetical protein